MSLATRTMSALMAGLDLDALASALTGDLLRPDDTAYDAARRGHNLAIDANPFDDAPESMSLFHIRVLGGAMSRVPTDATAFAHRDAPILSMQLSAFEDGDGTAQRAWVTRLHESLQPLAHGVYSNFLGDEDGRIGEAYPAETYARLAAVKQAYDPSNVFRRNQNIRPKG